MENLITKPSKDYELIDSGDGEKLERYGNLILRRPDPQVLWKKSLTNDVWEKADASYIRAGTSGKWVKSKELETPWKINLQELSFSLDLLPSKHLGVFPEQVEGWKWLSEMVETNIKNDKKISALNLFGYTGGATIAMAKAGAEVVHLDSSKFAVDLANKNLKDSGLEKSKVRFIVDDVRKFVEREIKRGNKYDIVTLDPPIYGKGSKGEVWKIDNDLVTLLSRIKNILSDKALAVVLNGYASNYSSATYANTLSSIFKDMDGKVEYGELSIQETGGNRLLTAGIFARWSK